MPYLFRVRKVKVNVVITENGLCRIISFPMKLHTKTSNEVRMCLMDVGVKGQGHNALIIENGLCCVIAFPFDLSS